MERLSKTKTTVRGSGTSGTTATEVIIENAAGKRLVKILVNDDGTALEITTVDGQRILKD